MAARAWRKEQSDKEKAAFTRDLIRQDINEYLDKIPETNNKGSKKYICGEIRILLQQLVESYEGS